MRLAFYVPGVPIPKGSMRAFLPRGRVSVSLTFYLPRPKSAPKAQVATKRPDIDKLARCALDALTLAHVYDDDSQVVELTAHKFYAFPGGPEPGVLVEVVG